MPDKSKKKETRIMKVTMDADEFEKYDKGETHSDKGVRNNRGKLSALPDIAPISEYDLPQRTVVRTQKVYVQPEEQTTGQMIKQAIKYKIIDEVNDIINDPRKRAIIVNRAKRFWSEYVKPLFTSDYESRYKPKADQILAKKEERKTEIAYQVETVNEKHERIVVTGEQAKVLVDAMRQKARELSAMIYLLSNISVKDKKTDSENVLEEAYIKQLISEETTSTIKKLVEHRQLLDEGTALCLEDWLNGYISNGEKRVPIPVFLDNGHMKNAKKNQTSNDEEE